MRPIDADALREILLDEAKDNWNMDTHTSWADALEEVASYVGEMPTITTAPRWIPVTERLPEKDGNVLVAHSNGFVCICMYWTEIADYYFRKAGITHWMSLPEPPKEREWVG